MRHVGHVVRHPRATLAGPPADASNATPAPPLPRPHTRVSTKATPRQPAGLRRASISTHSRAEATTTSTVTTMKTSATTASSRSLKIEPARRGAGSSVPAGICAA